jgi:hypothetical protein
VFERERERKKESSGKHSHHCLSTRSTKKSQESEIIVPRHGGQYRLRPLPALLRFSVIISRTHFWGSGRYPLPSIGTPPPPPNQKKEKKKKKKKKKKVKLHIEIRVRIRLILLSIYQHCVIIDQFCVFVYDCNNTWCSIKPTFVSAIVMRIYMCADREGGYVRDQH